MTGKHIHVHLHNTHDAGTSEGAKKAAQTRKSGGGGAVSTTHLPQKNAQGHQLHTYHKSGQPVGHGYHKDLTEARAAATKAHGPGAYATHGRSPAPEKREPNRKIGPQPD